MKNLKLLSIILFFTTLGMVPGDNVYYKINKNIDIFGKVYKEIVLNYVDEVDPERFIHAGIDGMLGTLDPYTIYIGENEGDDIELITHGEYGGVGVTIGVRDGNILVIAPMEGYSAHKQGIKAGDRILEIGGTVVTGMNFDSVRALVRGEPGTQVKMKIEREGEPEFLDFVLVREEIQVHNVSYSGMPADGIGYIKLDRFSRRAGDEVRQSIKDFITQTAMKGIILDLRDNPGGLLEAAVEISSNFLPKGSMVVKTKGRNSQEIKEYLVNGEPVASDLPVVVLINKNSASASEIVAGALQDLDRAVILGTRSFGKGLVQTVTALDNTSSLKITTARYYTPSGRSIQEIDYKNKKDGIFPTIPDSLKHKFLTKNGRIVLDAGGISPDSLVAEEEQSALNQDLLRRAMYFTFVTKFVARNKGNGSVVMHDTVYTAFEKFLRSQKYDFKDNAENKLSETREMLAKEHYSSDLIASIDKINEQIIREKETVFNRQKSELQRQLQEELVSRYAGERGRIKTSLAYDTQVVAAINILRLPELYKKILNQ